MSDRKAPSCCTEMVNALENGTLQFSAGMTAIVKNGEVFPIVHCPWCGTWLTRNEPPWKSRTER